MNKLTGGLGCAALAFGATLALGACGAGASLEPAKSAPAPTTVDEALANLDQAEGDINRVLGGPARPGFAQPPAAYPPRGESLGGAAPPPAPPTAPTEAVQQDSGDPCATACRALASMGRAAEHLCSLAGDSDSRCDTARGRVQSASQRVHASCPSCSD